MVFGELVLCMHACECATGKELKKDRRLRFFVVAAAAAVASKRAS